MKNPRDTNTLHSGEVAASYDRILPYRAMDTSLSSQFAEIYIEAFNDPDGAYGEQNTEESVLRDIWLPTIECGRITLAVEPALGGSKVIGLMCVQPMESTSVEEQEFAAKFINFLYCSEGIRAHGLPLFYLSELAVRKAYRNHPRHIGQELIRSALRDMSTRNDDGSFGRDDKIFILARTDAYRSMSRNTLARAGLSFCADFLQHADQSEQVIARGGHSVDKVWGWSVLHPIGGSW